jgi:hypothetical protein
MCDADCSSCALDYRCLHRNVDICEQYESMSNEFLQIYSRQLGRKTSLEARYLHIHSIFGNLTLIG